MADVTTTAAETTTTAAATDTTTTTTQGASTLLGNFANEQTTATQTTLGAVQTPAAETTTTTTDENAWLPEKFRVRDGDSINFTASAAKLGEAYTNLEKRFGAGDARPAEVAGYKFDETVLGEGFRDNFLASPGMDDFMKKVHEMGFNDKQLNFMLGELVQAMPQEAERVTGVSPADAQAALRAAWAEPAVYNRNMLAADAAARSLLKDDYAGFLNRYGNDPQIIKLLAQVGSEMSEDSLRLIGKPQLTAESVHDLMNSDAYFDENHPDHRRVAQQVRDYYARQSGHVILS